MLIQSSQGGRADVKSDLRDEIVLKSINLSLENYKDEMCLSRPGSANVKLDDLADSRFSRDSCCVCTYQKVIHVSQTSQLSAHTLRYKS